MIIIPKQQVPTYEYEPYATFITRYNSLDVSIDNLGASSDATKNVYGFAIGDLNSKPIVYVQASIHGAEWESAFWTLRFAEMLINPLITANSKVGKYLQLLKKRYSFYFIPVVNPWGFDNKIRENINEVDCNRDFDTFEENETIIVRNKMQELKPVFFIDNHCMTNSYNGIGAGNNTYARMWRNLIKSLNLILSGSTSTTEDRSGDYVRNYPIDWLTPSLETGRGWSATQLSNYGGNTIPLLIEAGWSAEHTSYLQEKAEYGLNTSIVALLYLDILRRKHIQNPTERDI